MKQKRITNSHAMQATVDCQRWLQKNMRANPEKAEKGKVNPMRNDIAKMLSNHVESQCEPVTAKASVETGVTTPLAEGADAGSRSSAPANQRSNHSARSRDMPSEDNLRVPKVNTKRLSKLACWILQNTGDGGIDRADIVARCFKVQRLYCGFYVDPCFGPTERRRHDRRYRHGQPRVTMTLKRLEKSGLIQLIRHGKYVKRIRLTEIGETISNALVNPDNSKKSNGT